MEKIYGIIGAMDVEVAGLTAQMTERTESSFGGSTFYSGRINGNKVVVTCGGIGKVNASFVATTLAIKFGVSAIVMTGVCGGVDLTPLDAIVPDGFVQHDVDMIGEEKGHIDVLNTVVILPDAELSTKLAVISGAKRGVMATGEQFISGQAQIDRLLADFPSVVAVDMESASVAQVCARLKLPYACIKIVSDGGDENAYYDFKTEASNKPITAVLALLK